jgi:hypothetical protein
MPMLRNGESPREERRREDPPRGQRPKDDYIGSLQRDPSDDFVAFKFF